MEPIAEPHIQPVMLRFIDLLAGITVDETFFPASTTYLAMLDLARKMSASVSDQLQGLGQSRLLGQGLQVSEGHWWYRIVRQVREELAAMSKGPWLVLDNTLAYQNLTAELTQGLPIEDGWVEVQHDLQKQRDYTTAQQAQVAQDNWRTALVTSTTNNPAQSVSEPGPAIDESSRRKSSRSYDSPLIVHSPIPPGYNSEDEEKDDEEDQRYPQEPQLPMPDANDNSSNKPLPAVSFRPDPFPAQIGTPEIFVFPPDDRDDQSSSNLSLDSYGLTSTQEFDQQPQPSNAEYGSELSGSFSAANLQYRDLQQPINPSHFDPSIAAFVPGSFSNPNHFGGTYQPNNLYVPSHYDRLSYPADLCYGYPQQSYQQPDFQQQGYQQPLQYQRRSQSQNTMRQPVRFDPRPNSGRGSMPPNPSRSAHPSPQLMSYLYGSPAGEFAPASNIKPPPINTDMMKESEIVALQAESRSQSQANSPRHPFNQSFQSLYNQPHQENFQTASVHPSPVSRPAVKMPRQTNYGTHAATMSTASQFNNGLTMAMESMSQVNTAVQQGLINPAKQPNRTSQMPRNKRSQSQHTYDKTEKHPRHQPLHFNRNASAGPPVLGQFSPPKSRMPDYHALRVLDHFNYTKNNSRAFSSTSRSREHSYGYRNRGADPALDINNGHEFIGPRPRRSSTVSTAPTVILKKSDISRPRRKSGDAVPKDDAAVKKVIKEKMAQDRAERAKRRSSQKWGEEDSAAAGTSVDGAYAGSAQAMRHDNDGLSTKNESKAAVNQHDG